MIPRRRCGLKYSTRSIAIVNTAASRFAEYSGLRPSFERLHDTSFSRLRCCPLLRTVKFVLKINVFHSVESFLSGDCAAALF